jgi:hypothetical protein
MSNHLFNANSLSNHNIFIPYNSGSPQADLERHISGLGLARLDFERDAVAGEVIFAVEGDWAPTSQMDEEARIGSIAYALKKLGNPEDAVEFIRCLNAICENGDALSRQTVARYYYGEIARRGAGPVLKEMGLIAMHLASLNPVDEVVGVEDEAAWELHGKSNPRSLFDQEVAEVERMIRGRRKSRCFAHDEWTEWLNDLEANGASLKELDDAFAQVEASDQYDENGAIIVMSAHERTRSCGRVDPEITADDLPVEARHLLGEMRRAYASGVEIKEIWEEIDAQLGSIFPVFGRTPQGSRFFSRANAEWQRFTRESLELLLEEFSSDCHLTAMRHSHTYHRFYSTIREAGDTRIVGQALQDAYAAKESGELSLKHFTLLTTAAALQRERLMNARLSPEAYKLIREIDRASGAELRYLSWAIYGNNVPEHPVHKLPTQEVARIWQHLKDRKCFFARRKIALVMALYLLTRSEACIGILKFALSYLRMSGLPNKPMFHIGRDRRVQVTVRRVHGENLLNRRA